MRERTRTNRALPWALMTLTALPLLFGCAAGSDPQPEEMTVSAEEEEAPLGGEALARRRMDLDRAWRDLLHFELTMSSLVDRKDSRSVALLDGFLDEYMSTHLAGLLRRRGRAVIPK